MKTNKIEKKDKCKRCGTPYMTKGVYVCGCHPMFHKDYNWEGGYIEFSTPEDAQKAITLAKALLTSEVERVLREVDKEIENEKYWDSEGWEAQNYDEKVFNTGKFSEWLRKRKALSELKGGDTK